MSKLDEYRLKNTTLEIAVKNLLQEINMTKDIPSHYIVNEVERGAYMSGLLKAYELMVDAKDNTLLEVEDK